MDVRQFYTIEDGKVFLNETKWFKKREVAHIDETTQDIVLETLLSKFSDLQKEWEEFKAQFETETESTKLAGKLSQKKSYFIEAKAIGDYEPIFTEIDVIEKRIEDRVLQVINRKTEICNELNKLVVSDHQKNDGWKQATEVLNGLKKEFTHLPQVPHPEDEGLRLKLEESINLFFNEKQKYFDEFEKELLVNLDRKLELCERAEGIKDSDDWRKTSETYAQLLELWKSVGPVPRHKNEELWIRFNAAKDHFYTNKQKFYDELIENLEENLKQKEELIKQAEALKESTDWNKTTQEMNELMEAWKKIGGVGKEKNDEIWDKFNGSRDYFFTNKKNHFAQQKIEQEDNLAKKIALAKRANELKDSTDYDHATQEFQELMDEWKKVGYAPRKLANEQWEIFITARKHFFAKKDASRDEQRGELLEIISNRIGKNIGFINKLHKELTIEQEVVDDFMEKLNHIAPSARAFETRERYEHTISEARKKVESVQKKIDEVQAKVDADKKERNRLSYHNKKSGQEPTPNEPLHGDKPTTREKREYTPRTAASKKDNMKSNTPSKTLLGEALKGLDFTKLD